MGQARSLLLESQLYWWSIRASIQVDGKLQDFNQTLAIAGFTPQDSLVNLLQRFQEKEIMFFTATRVAGREAKGG